MCESEFGKNMIHFFFLAVKQYKLGMLRMFAFAYTNFKNSHSQMMRMNVQVTACNCNEPSTSSDCSAKSLISNLDSSSEDEGSDLESGHNRHTQEREIKAQLKAYLKEKRSRHR